MKSIFFYCTLVMLLLFQACLDPDNLDNLSDIVDQLPVECPEIALADITDLPDETVIYLEDNHQGISIVEVNSYDDHDFIFYVVELEDGTLIAFDENGNELGTGARQVIDAADLPTDISDYLAVHHASADVVLAEKIIGWTGDFIYVVELADGTVAYFSEDGELLCGGYDDDDDDGNDDDDDGYDDDDDDGYDDDDDDGNDDDDDGYDDDDDDDGNDDQDELSQDIQDFLAGSYTDYEVEDIDEIVLCDGTEAIAVEIEHDDEDLVLIFTIDSEFLYEITEIESDELPLMVLDAIINLYAGYELEDESHLLALPDGSVYYMVELEHDDNDSELRVTFTADGDFVCEENL